MVSDAEMQRINASAELWFGKLMTFFFDKGFENFWWLGNCFDTITDYLLVFDVPLPEGTMKTVLDKYKLWRESNDQSKTVNTWYDDWAWWAIASAKAYDLRYSRVFGSYAAAFTGVAEDCWTIVDRGLGDGVHLGAPNAYENRENMKCWVNPPAPQAGWYAPLIEGGRGSGLHGTWQYEIFSIARPTAATDPPPPPARWTGPFENTQANPSWPVGDWPFWLGAYQLTVMNALYLLLAARLEQAHKINPSVPSAATQLADEYGFLWAWFGKDDKRPLPAGVPALLQPFGDGQVVRERVSKYASRNGTYDDVNFFAGKNSWGGDIGLVLNGLAIYNTLYPDSHPERPLANLIKQLVLGYIAAMYDSAAKEPKPYYPLHGGIFDNDVPDYKSGIGVFMRSLLQASAQAHSPVWEVLKGYSTVRDFLAGCGEWAQRQVITPKTDAFDCLNVLATLTAVRAIPH